MEDEELAKIRNKKLKDLEAKMKEKTKGRVLHIDQGNFPLMLKEHHALVVDFWAEWCGPCRTVTPVVEELATEFAGRITFGKCNTDDNTMLAGQFGISAIPALLFFLDGHLIDRAIGAYPKEALRTKIVQAFGTSVNGPE